MVSVFIRKYPFRIVAGGKNLLISQMINFYMQRKHYFFFEISENMKFLAFTSIWEIVLIMNFSDS